MTYRSVGIRNPGCHIPMLLTAFLLVHASVEAQELAKGRVVNISFVEADLPPTLHSMWSEEQLPPCMSVRLPDDYSPEKKYPLLLYVPGGDGGDKGNIAKARTVVGDRGWIVASVPLFKSSIDRAEIGGGIIVSFNDYQAISGAYSTMLGRLFELVPNIDRSRSTIAGFSNGAITVAVLVSSHDEFILKHFGNFCLVDHGMFHLVDIHKKGTRDSRFLILVGDRDGPGRDLKIRQGQLQRDVAKTLGVHLDFRIMKDTGHEFGSRQMAMVGTWIQGKSLNDHLGE